MTSAQRFAGDPVLVPVEAMGIAGLVAFVKRLGRRPIGEIIAIEVTARKRPLSDPGQGTPGTLWVLGRWGAIPFAWGNGPVRDRVWGAVAVIRLGPGMAALRIQSARVAMARCCQPESQETDPRQNRPPMPDPSFHRRYPARYT